MTLLYLVAAWTAGIFLASSGQSPAGLWLLLAAGAFGLAYALRHNRARGLALTYLALFALGAARASWATRPLPDHHIAHQVDTGYVTLTGIISQDADVRDTHVNLRLDVESVQRSGITQSAAGIVLVQASRYSDYAYGDRVTAGGALPTPPEFDDFSYRDYLARRGIHAIMPNAEVERVAADQGRPWYAALYDLKRRAQHTIDQLLPSPEAPLLSGILLGVESSISDDVREAFNRTGTSHVIAISGANIIVVIRALMGLLEPPLGKRRAGWVTLVGVGGYTLFVGADPAVVRAAIMGSLALLATQWGRRTYGLTSLAFAVWLMTLWNPLTLWDIGFQLSVAATAGLVLFSGGLEQRLDALLRRIFAPNTARSVTRWLAEPVVVSLAAQITTTPLILVYFGRLSVVSLLANVLIVPAQAYIMLLGWIAVLLGLLWTSLGELAAWIVWLPLTYTIRVVRGLAQIEWASATVALSPTYAWAFYALLGGVALLSIQHPDDRATLFRRVRQHVSASVVAGGGAIVAVLVWIAAFQQPDGRLHVWFLDVGHGHAVLIQTPNGAQVLIDGGPNPTRLRRVVGDRLPFWDRDLDLLVVTQPKASAIDALPALLDRYQVEVALTTGQPAASDAYIALFDAWADQQTQVVPVTAGYRVAVDDGVTLEVLHPQLAPPSEAEPEDVGMVLRLSYGDTSFLITPDLSPEAEQALAEAGWYTGSTVLELPSRGSDRASSAEFLQAVQPQAAVVSLGAGSRQNLPAPEVVSWLDERAIPLYRTDHDGTVEIVTDGRTLWIYRER